MQNRKGFTLVELLVVIGILVVLAAMTLKMVNVTQDEDRVRAGAAQVQSFLEGARDRAIHAKEPRGVRFMFEEEDGVNVATSLLYIGPPENYTVGQISIGDPATGTDLRLITLIGDADWGNLLARGLIPVSGAVLRVGDQNAFYTMRWDGTNFRLTKDYNGPLLLPESYTLQLNPAVLPNQEPRNLPRDVVIDLNNSAVPNNWKSGQTFGPHLDLLFSPNGTVTGLSASAGAIYLVVAEGVDVYQSRTPGSPAKEGQERIVSVRTQTGAIGVHHVDPTDADADGSPDDFLKYAANGEPAK